jgi:hypothetical protein
MIYMYPIDRTKAATTGENRVHCYQASTAFDPELTPSSSFASSFSCHTVLLLLLTTAATTATTTATTTASAASCVA